MHYVYVIRNLINNFAYVGQTRNFAQRRAGHIYSMKKGDTRPLYCAMREQGESNFSFEIIEECESEEIASLREEFWVEHYDSFNNGYNLTHGGGYHVGNRGRKFSEDHKRKISEAHKGKKLSDETRQKLSEIQKGTTRKPHTDEARQKMSDAKKGILKSDEHKQKIRETLTGRKLSEETIRKLTGKRHSEETKQKMRESHLGQKRSEESKRKMSEAAKLREERKRQEKDNT